MSKYHRVLIFCFALVAISACSADQAQDLTTIAMAVTTTKDEIKFSPSPLTTSTTTLTPPTQKPTSMPTLENTSTPIPTKTQNHSVTLTPLALTPASPLNENMSTETGVYAYIRADAYAFLQDGMYFGRYIDEARLGPGGASYLAFAHHSNWVAYWMKGSPNQLWISDLSNTKPYLIFSDYDDVYSIDSIMPDEILLEWSPDDLHLVLDVKSKNYQDLIFHLESGIVERWNYDCNQVAWSPRTERLATWCISETNNAKYAVMEWGGEIWYSNAAPESPLVRSFEEAQINWGWSSDGSQIAFFNPDDPEGYFNIASENGAEVKTLPGSAFWLAEAQPVLMPPVNPIQWSSDGSKILVYAYDSQGRACPQWENIYVGDGIAYAVPCWQVVDAATGNVVWSLSDSAEEILEDYYNIVQNWRFFEATISPDGKYVMIAADCSGLYAVRTIDIQTPKVIAWWDYSVSDIKWSK